MKPVINDSVAALISIASYLNLKPCTWVKTSKVFGYDGDLRLHYDTIAKVLSLEKVEEPGAFKCREDSNVRTLWEGQAREFVNMVMFMVTII